MPARKAQPPRSIAGVTIPSVDDPAVSRALDALADAVSVLSATASRQVIDVDLAIGLNVIPHSLGRAVRSVTVTPSVADATFAWALRRDGLNASKHVLIDVVGVAQARATVEVR